ncbi:MAG: SGNH/GDSL hydrolase family protein [Myxococcaceae bacterium]|jgi:hypothetical protein|nr:SGNH/GDSL hydrolase family protein [Myxococcaceae bacterium]
MLRRAALLLALASCGAPPGMMDDDGGLELEPDAGPMADAGPGPADGGSADGGDTGDGGGALDGGGGSTDAGGGVDAGGEADGLFVYPFDRTHSPLTAQHVRALGVIAARAPRSVDAFMKVGDSNTVNPNFLGCFAGANVDLGGRVALQPTLDALKTTRLSGTTPFERVSRSATVGWSAGAALAGTPPPVEQELSATNARFATVMFGTNDIQAMNLDAYGRAMFSLVDWLAARGVVPLLTSIPPRDDSATADAQVPWYNGVTRALAQARGVPFVDLERELRLLPNHGLSTADGLHLNVFVQNGAARGCVLTGAGLQFGHNRRNLLTLEALRRARDAVASGAVADVGGAVRRGTGTRADPIVVDSLPFVDVRDTRRDGARTIDTYGACSPANEGGPEVLYRLDVTQSRAVRAVVVSLGAADVDVHLLQGSATGAACVARNDKAVTATLTSGAWFLALDTFVSSGAERAGEYALVVLPQ